MAKAFVIGEICVIDPTKFSEYRELSTAAVEKFGGTWLARGGERTQLEGGDGAHNAEWRTVIVEFPSVDSARAWYDSMEYTKAREVRIASSIGRLYIVSGVR